jgi:hypothetical protein
MSRNLEKLNGNENDQQNGSENRGAQDHRVQIRCAEIKGRCQEKGTRG